MKFYCRKLITLFPLLIFFITTNTFAVENKCTKKMKSILAKNAIGRLQSKYIFAEYSEDEVPQIFAIDGSSKVACGPICGVNLLQGVRELLGLPLIENPTHLVQEIFRQRPSTMITGNNSDDLHGIFEYVLSKFEEIGSYTVTSNIIEILSKQNQKSGSAVNITNEINVDMITPQPNEIVALAYVVITPDGKIKNGHIVLVSGVHNNKISILEPSSPDKFIEFTMKPVGLNPTNSSIELIPGKSYNEINKSYVEGSRYFAYFYSTITVDN